MYVWQVIYCVVEAFPTGERLSPSWLKYTFFVFRSHWFACSVTFLSLGQFGFGAMGDAGFYVLLYVPRLLSVPVLGLILAADICRSNSPTLVSTCFGYWLVWGFPLTSLSYNAVRLPHLIVEQVACCGRVGEEVKLGSRYSQLLTNTCCLFEAWALHVDVSRANHFFRCLSGSFLTWLLKLFQPVRGCHLLGWNTPFSYFALTDLPVV